MLQPQQYTFENVCEARQMQGLRNQQNVVLPVIIWALAKRGKLVLHNAKTKHNNNNNNRTWISFDC